jgi:hypothetical protein
MAFRRLGAIRVCVLGGLVLAGSVAGAGVAAAQYRPPARPAVGEDYHIEAAYGWWSAEPTLVISSESLGITGDDIDLIGDLGIEQQKVGKFDLVLRPAEKHRFRFGYLPVTYEADTTVRRTFVFNGQRYNVGLPVQTTASFKTYRFGYDYDFLYFKRGFVGVLLDLKYTDVNVELNSPIGSEFTTAVAPIPTIGFVARGYAAPNLALGAEMSFFRVPKSLRDTFDGHYYDFDFYGTVNFNRYVGAQMGFKSIDVFYALDEDEGTLKFSGLYFGGVIRY